VFALVSVAPAQIINGDFEGEFSVTGLAEGWTLFWTSGYIADADREQANVVSGDNAQRIVLPQPAIFGNGGILQTVATIPNQLYRLRFWMYISIFGETYESEDLETFVGFDTRGRNVYDHDAFTANTDWDVGWIRAGGDRHRWLSVAREFYATESATTIFFRGVRKWPQHGSAYVILDNMTLEPITQNNPLVFAAIPPPESPPLTGANLLANPDFETGFSGGVGQSWQQWTSRGVATFSPSADLGKIGGGHYNPAGGNAMLSLSATAKVALAMPPSLGMLTQVKQNNPDILTCGRIDVDDYNFWDDSDAETISLAHWHASRSLIAHNEHPGIDCWQGYNEPWVETRERARKVAVFEKAFAERCTQLGIRSCILNLAVGTPNLQNAGMLRDALAVADFVGYHSYGGPNDQFQVGPEAADHSLRWRTIKQYYDEQGWRCPPAIYTEAGTYAAWQGSYSSTEVRDNYAAFGHDMMDDEWCVGEAIFTVGAYSPWHGWDIAPYSDIINGLRDWNTTHSADARGGKSQKLNCSGSNFLGGIVQAVGSSAGTHWLSGWFKYEDGNGGQPNDKDFTFQIGYDPTGQTSNNQAGTIVWSSDQIGSRFLNGHTWYAFGLPVEATGPQTSVWFSVDQDGTSPSIHVYVDALDLRTTAGPIPPLPAIDLSPATLLPVCEEGTNAPEQILNVANAGGGKLIYAITDNTDWLYTNAISGTSSGETDAITVRYNTTALPVGTHHATIEVTAPGSSNTPQSVSVSLTVEEPPGPGDLDHDGDVDQEDFGQFQSCFSAPGVTQSDPACLGARLDNDDDVDADDFRVFAGCMSGPNIPSDPDCQGA